MSGRGVVEVNPDSVLLATAQLRRAARAYADAGWRISTNTPMMPPLFLAHCQATVDVAALRLQALAARMEVVAAAEAWRISRLVGADGGDVGAAARQLESDLQAQAAEGWGRLSAESGPQAWRDPLAGNVHVLLGAGDNISQLFHVAQTLGHLDPAYAATDPEGSSRARHEAIAMALNLVRLFPETAIVDPQGHQAAVNRTAAKLIDLDDLRSGDMPRWAGHIGSGILLGWLVRGLAPAEEGAPATAGATVRIGYDAVGHANRLPADPPPEERPGEGPMVRRAESRIEGFLAQP